ncbi:MAG TPA: hypothetical protein VH351_16695 [Bryobacteraceae bacterium]|nr:hypothetical protein [Bryobacteraceae bacterium]
MPVTAKTTLQFLWRDASINSQFRTGVSLHSHTQYSEESLELIPKYLGGIPLLRRSLENSVPYERAFWTPPLTPRQAYRLEEKQIQRRLQLPALVSLTDHDNIHAGTVLHLLDRFNSAPVSTEWTIPVGPTFFHLGVHNLPLHRSERIIQELNAYTASPTPAALTRTLALLNAFPDVLVVVNHPLWDEKGIGQRAHRGVLLNLLKEQSGTLHALEMNGLRSWQENQQVLELGAEMGLPVAGGGDRHGREPNAVLNLSSARTFAQFVEEVRYEGRSHVAFMPQYRLSRVVRTTRMVIDALREYPERVHARRTWRERVFYRATPESEPVLLASLWPRGRTPLIIQAADATVKLASSGFVRPFARFAMAEASRA